MKQNKDRRGWSILLVYSAIRSLRIGSADYRLKRVGEATAPWGTPAKIMRYYECSVPESADMWRSFTYDLEE